MTYENIGLDVGIEQTVQTMYGDALVRIDINWNDRWNAWYIDVQKNDNYILRGVIVSINTNLFFDSMGLGALYFRDTYPENRLSEPITKEDMGDRIKLTRYY